MLPDEWLSDWIYANPDNPEEPEDTEWCCEEDPIEGYCDVCEAPIRRGETALGIVVKGKDGKYKPVCVCSDCLESESVSRILEVCKIWHWEDDADYVCHATVDKAKKLNREIVDQRRHMIGTAAKMVRQGV